MKAIVRKLSMLALLFSGMFLLIQHTVGSLLSQGGTHAWVYPLVQVIGFLFVVLLLARKRITVY